MTTEAHGVSVPEPHHKVNYLAVFILLVVLTVVTVAVAFINIKSELSKILLALSIASVKAAAVVLYFMHVKFEGKLIYLILIVPIVIALFAKYLALSMEPGSSAQKPEKLFRESGLIVLVVWLAAAFSITTFADIPELEIFTAQRYIQVQ